MRKMHRYTKEQIEYIREISPNRLRNEIRDLVNAKYGLSVTTKSIAGIMYRNDIKNNMQGFNTRFEQGHETWNKGKFVNHVGSRKTQFKKGHSMNSVEIGSERTQEGRVFIKVEQPNVWVEKHRWLWEQYHGEIPEGTAIVFKDGDRENVTIENLFATTRSAAVAVARRGLPDEPELKISSHRLAELDIAIRKVTENENTL